MGVVSNPWSDRALLSILYMFKPSCLTDVHTPFLGTPLVPLEAMVGGGPGKNSERVLTGGKRVLPRAVLVSPLLGNQNSPRKYPFTIFSGSGTRRRADLGSSVFSFGGRGSSRPQVHGPFEGSWA